MKKSLLTLLCVTLCLAALNSIQAATMSALTSFGGGDGWIAPGELPKLGSADLERGMAYNPATNNVLFVSRNAGVFVEVLDGQTGADVGNLNTTGITGGTFALSTIGVADDGVIYAANLTLNSTTSPYKIYRWQDESSVPTVAYSGGTAATRIGDSLDVYGSGTNTRIVAGHGTPSNNFSIYQTGDGAVFSGSEVVIGSNPPAAASFRLGITFQDSDTIIGRGDGNNTRIVDVAAGLTSGTLVASNSFAPGSTLRQLDYTVLGNGIPILAVLQNAGTFAGAGTTSRVFVYDMTDPNNPIEIAQKSNTTSVVANGNGVGNVKFGKTTYRKAVIYAMDTNNGIQAFELTTVPEPTSLALCGLGLAVMGVMRGRRNGR